jgi:Tfp pilus assembly protein PilF
VFLAAGHSNQARAWVARALELDPRLSEALVVEGDLALAAGDAVAARQSYQRATEARPNNQQAWQKLGALRP